MAATAQKFPARSHYYCDDNLALRVLLPEVTQRCRSFDESVSFLNRGREGSSVDQFAKDIEICRARGRSEGRKPLGCERTLDHCREHPTQRAEYPATCA
jgi:hypothetical protein